MYAASACPSSIIETDGKYTLSVGLWIVHVLARDDARRDDVVPLLPPTFTPKSTMPAVAAEAAAGQAAPYAPGSARVTRDASSDGGHHRVPHAVVVRSESGPGLLQPAGGVPAGQAPMSTRKSPSGLPFAWIGDVGFCGCAANGGFEYACPL